MRNIASLLILLAGFTRNCCLAATPNPSTSPNITISNSSSDEEISRLIDTGLTRKDFKAIQAISSQVSSVFAGTDPNRYARLTARLAGAIDTFDMNEPSQYEYASSIAASALAKVGDDTPLVIELRLAQCLRLNPPGARGFNEAVRAKYVGYWVHLLQRIETYASLPEEVIPPVDAIPRGFEGDVLFSGASPSAIKDPKRRAEYEAAVKLNDEIILRQSERQTAITRKRTAVSSFKTFVTSAYTVNEVEAQVHDPTGWLNTIPFTSDERRAFMDGVNGGTK